MSLVVAVSVVAFGAMVGGLSGLFGVGGGLLMVPVIVLALGETQHVAEGTSLPVIVLALGETQHVAEGTSLLVIVPAAVAGIVAHHQRGYVAFRAAGILTIGGLVGAVAGALIALNVDTESLQTVFAVFVLAVGARTVRDGWREHKDPSVAPQGT